jgi:hypothetical protein
LDPVKGEKTLYSEVWFNTPELCSGEAHCYLEELSKNRDPKDRTHKGCGI